MAEVSTDQIKDVRDRTGAGMLDCKKALIESGGDAEKAILLLREKGLAKAAKRSGRETGEGRVIAYIHGEGRIGVLLQLGCETDFVARNADFEALGKDIAMQIAAMSPLSISAEDLAASEIEKERQVYRQQLIDEGKPADRVDQIVEGKIKKFYTEVCLLEQAFIKDQKRSIRDVVNEHISKFGENIAVVRFTRYAIGG